MTDDPDHISFAEWLIDLNAEAIRTGYMELPFVGCTGQLCWYPDYSAGLKPGEALCRASIDGLQFGFDYCD